MGLSAMSEDEILVFIVSGVVGLFGMGAVSQVFLPRHFTRGNPGIGLMRLSVLASVLWTAFVIQYYGDPSIQGVYVTFYLVMAYAATKMFGQVAAQIFGIKIQTDAYQRNNSAAAVFFSAFALATGIVFGGSLWGEADPLSDAEGGWWIPLGFFLMGWITLALSTAVYLWREPGRFRAQICQERDTPMAWSAAVYVVSASTLIFRGVAGDFWGWKHGIFGMGTIALMLIGHEAVLFLGARRPDSTLLRLFERAMYIGLGVAAWYVNRLIDAAFVGG